MTTLILILLAFPQLQPPAAREVPFEIEAHGHSRTDLFYWLRDIENDEVMEYLRAENSYTDSVMSSCESLADTLATEMLARIPGRDSSIPVFRNGFWYWHEYPEGEEYALHMRRRNGGGEDEVLLDENSHARGRDYFMVVEMSVSPDNTVLAWAFDTTGGYWNTLVFQDIHTGETLDSVRYAAGDIAWASDSRTVFYGLKDPTGRTDRIMRRTVGCDDEVCVFEETDSSFWPWVWNSVDMQWVAVSSGSTLESECLLLRADSPRDSFQTVHSRTEGLEYYVEPMGDSLFILTNLEGENFSLMKAGYGSAGPEEWTTVIPHSDTMLLEKVDVLEEVLAVSARTGGLRKLLLVDRVTGEIRPASLGGDIQVFYTSGNHDVSADSLRLSCSSMVLPWSTAAYDIAADTVRILKTAFAGEDYDASLYETRRLTVPAVDGAAVPVTLVYRSDLFSEGGNPLLLYGYGAYGSSTDPSFSSTKLSLLDRGFVYAIAHVRGGSEMGRSWYDRGRVLAKMNTFTDFIDCAEYLIGEGFCDPERLFASGESAGGLLMGAVVNMRPDLWRGVIAGVPFVDVLTTMLDPTIPLTTNEYDEWGNPEDSEEEYFYILSYSPVDNLEAVDYPAMYVYTGLHDTQVGYWEPAKWVAGIRKHNTGDAPVLLRVDMGAGHGGASGRFSWVYDQAERYAFLLGLI